MRRSTCIAHGLIRGSSERLPHPNLVPAFVTDKLSSITRISACKYCCCNVHGINTEHMPELTWTSGYPLVIGLTGVICGYVYWRFKRSSWL